MKNKSKCTREQVAKVFEKRLMAFVVKLVGKNFGHFVILHIFIRLSELNGICGNKDLNEMLHEACN